MDLRNKKSVCYGWGSNLKAYTHSLSPSYLYFFSTALSLTVFAGGMPFCIILGFEPLLLLNDDMTLSIQFCVLLSLLCFFVDVGREVWICYWHGETPI